ncbi:MAG TPA: hypothetical protein VF721_03300, partial [Pyrinomonadaceae bacterium]
MTRQIFACIVFIVAFSTLICAQKANKSSAGFQPEIQKIVREISARRIEADIRRLVSFGTRNTLSEQNNPARGIGAARDWIYGEFQKISADCGNCLTV